MWAARVIRNAWPIYAARGGPVRKVRDSKRRRRYPHGFAATSKNKKITLLCAKPTNNYYTTRDKAAAKIKWREKRAVKFQKFTTSKECYCWRIKQSALWCLQYCREALWLALSCGFALRQSCVFLSTGWLQSGVRQLHICTHSPSSASLTCRLTLFLCAQFRVCWQFYWSEINLFCIGSNASF